MIIWIFMALDLMALVAVGLAHFGMGFYTTLLFMSAAYLGVKGFLFFDEFMSKVDLGIAVYLLLMVIFNFTSFIDYIIFGWFLYKLVFTMLE